MAKEAVVKLLSRNSYYVEGNLAPSDISGIGNAYVPILSKDGSVSQWVLYLFDSHNLSQDQGLGYYDWIKPDQIAWYRGVSDSLRSVNKKKLPAVAFFHIPFPEFNAAGSLVPAYGNKKEGVCAPYINSGLFASFLEKRDVIGAFVGHDHNNDYMADINGNILLGYGRKTGYASAYTEVLERGVRVISLSQNEAKIKTHIEDLKGSHYRYTFEQKNNGVGIPFFAGSFIQEFLVKDWDAKRWDDEMQMYQSVGMKYMIYAPSLLVNAKGETRTTYPSKLTSKKRSNNTLEMCLASAQKYNIKVFVGLNFNERWWKVDYDEQWLLKEMGQGNIVAQEIFDLYKKKYPEALHGWYWVWEVDNLHCQTSECQQALVKALNTNLDYLTALDADMPFMLSPYMNHAVGLDAEGYGAFWTDVFKETNFRGGDIFSPQDCVGAGGLNLQNLDEWFRQLKKAVDSKAGLKFWGNVETFEQASWTSASLQRVQKQLDIVNKYTSNIICFAYSHYNSPYVVNENYHEAYRHYIYNGLLPNQELKGYAATVLRKDVKNGVEISWTPSLIEDSKVDGILIYKNGELLKKIQFKKNRMLSSFFDKTGGENAAYEIALYNVLGCESERIKVQ